MTSFSGCTDLGGQIKYLCAWAEYGKSFRMVSSNDAKNLFPQLIVEFLEPKFDFLNGVPPSWNVHGRGVYLTRSIEGWAAVNNVSFDPKVNVVRNLGLEKYLLRKPVPQPINQRRATGPVNIGMNLNNPVPQPINQRRGTGPINDGFQIRRINQIPFGVRGRKRNTITMAYVGIQPNPDSRQLVVPPLNR